MISKVDHIQFAVTDVEAEVAFMEKFGLEVVYRTAKGSVLMKFPGENQVKIKFVEAKDGQMPGLEHVSFDLTNGVEERERLKEEGIEFLFEGRYVPSYQHEVSNFNDPSGILWQITEEVGHE